MKYRKKPVIIDAIQWNGDNLSEVICFTDGSIGNNRQIQKTSWKEYRELVKNEGFKVYTLEGIMNVNIGDFVIRGVKGELYPCKPDIFELTYELIDKEED